MRNIKIIERILKIIVAILIMIIHFVMFWFLYLILGKGTDNWNVYVTIIVIISGVYNTYEFFKGMDDIN